jgi:hypothetical protein
MTDISTTTQLPEKESGRHPVNVGHLVMGVALLGLLVVWALIVGDVVEDEDVRWLLPAPWVLAGAAGLIALAVGGHRGHETRQTGWVTPPAPDSTEDPVETAEQTTDEPDLTIEEPTEDPTEETR